VALRAAVRDSLRAVLTRAVADSAFPGAFAVVGNSHEVLGRYGAGHLDWRRSPVPDANTMWDLASLTKVIGTTTAIMQLWQRHLIDLDAPVQRYVPSFTGREKERVTIRALLTHSSGLPGWRPLYLEATSRNAILALVDTTPLDTVPGTRMVYSDLGAIVLGQAITRITHEALDRYLAENVFNPLRMTSTMFRPPCRLLARIAPTEQDPWRGHQLRGQVHDENAFALGGVSSHAGLFSTGADLVRFAQMYLNGGAIDGHRIVTRTAIDTFTAVQNPSLSNRALGWEVTTGRNSGGHHLSPGAFGHTGFTGTSIWIDPTRNLFVVLLTNRVNPTRENHKIAGVRIALADAVVGAVDAARSDRQPASGSPSSGSP